MRTGPVNHRDLSIFEHDPVERVFVRGAVEIVNILIKLREMFSDTFHKGGLTGAWTPFQADNPRAVLRCVYSKRKIPRAYCCPGNNVVPKTRLYLLIC